MADVTIEMARKAKTLVRDLAAGLTQVSGVGLSRIDGSYAVKVNLREACKLDIPAQVNGVPVVCEYTGPISVR